MVYKTRPKTKTNKKYKDRKICNIQINSFTRTLKIAGIAILIDTLIKEHEGKSETLR